MSASPEHPDNRDYFERLWDRIQHGEAVQPPPVPVQRRRAQRPAPRAYAEFTASEVAAWRAARHQEQRRGQRRQRVSTGQRKGRQAKPPVPGIEDVERLVTSRVGRTLSGGTALRCLGLVALVAGGGMNCVDALRVYPRDLARMRLPLWAWKPLRAILRVRGRRWIDDGSPVLACTRFGSCGKPWNTMEAWRALKLTQVRFWSQIYTIRGFKLANKQVHESELVAMPPIKRW